MTDRPMMGGGRPLRSGGRITPSGYRRQDGFPPPRPAAAPPTAGTQPADGRGGPVLCPAADSKRPSLRGRAAAWFASLEPSERSKLFTFEDPSWCLLTANMAARATFQATALEMELTEVSGGTGPAALFRAAAEVLERSALAHGNPPTALTFSEALLKDPEEFFRAMDTVSGGRFLRDPDILFADPGSKRTPRDGSFFRKRGSSAFSATLGANGGLSRGSRGFGRDLLGDKAVGGADSLGSGTDAEDWAQCPWLVGMGGFSLAAFLANRVEVRLRSALQHGQSEVPFSVSASIGAVSRRGKGVAPRRGGAGASKPGCVAGLAEARCSLEAFLASLSEEDRLRALSASATGSLTKLLRGNRDTAEMAMYKSGFLGGRPPGGLPPRQRYEDMDWVRGRPPDALLFLKTLVKAARPAPSRNLFLPLGEVKISTAAISRTSAGVGASVVGGKDGRSKLVGVATAVGETTRQATGVQGVKGGGRARGHRVDATPGMPAAAMGAREAARALAESALLGPLREVGTVAGALRGGIGGYLREMAAARAAKDLTDLILQEAAAATSSAPASVKDGRKSLAAPAVMSAARVVESIRGGAKGRGKKKRTKKKRQQAGGASGGGDAPSSAALKVEVVGSSERRGGERGHELEGGAGAKDDAPADEHLANGGGCSTDSSADSAVGGRTEARADTEASSKPRAGTGESVCEQGPGDESLDDEEEQRGVVKKLRWRTEVGWMGPSAIPAGSAPASGGSSCGDCRGGCRGDGFVIPLDVRRRGKVRALAHSLVTDVVEAVLRRCVLETATPLPIPTTKAATGFKRTADMALSKEAADATIAAVAAKTPTVTPSADATIAAVAVKTPTVKPSAAAPCSVIPAAAFKRAALSATVKPGAVELLPTCPWPSPAESMPPLLWKIPAATGVQGARGAVNAGAIAKTRLQSPSSPVLVAAVASPSSAANAGGDSTSSPSVLRSPPRLRGGARLSRRWEARTVRGASGRELTAANDADERMSWSSFDSLDVRVDDQDFADITDLGHRQRMPSTRVPSTKATKTSATLGQRSAPGYFPSPASPRPSSPRPAPAPLFTATASFHDHGMALDWRTCCAVSEAGESAVEAAAGSVGGERRPVGVIPRGSGGVFAVGVGSGSSFFGGQGLFSWTPSLDGRFSAKGTSGAWGGAGTVDHQPSLDSWDGSVPEVGRESEMDVSVKEEGKAIADEPDRVDSEGIYPPSREQADEPQATSGNSGNEESRRGEGNLNAPELAEPVEPAKHRFPVDASAPAADVTEILRVAPANRPTKKVPDGTKTPVIVPAAEIGNSIGGGGAPEEGRPVSPNDRESCALSGDGADSQLPAGAGDRGDGEGDDGPDIQTSEPPISVDVRTATVEKERVGAAAAVVGCAKPAASWVSTSVNTTASGDASASSQHPAGPGGGKCCSCACHGSPHPAWPPPTPMPARSRASRRHQRRRASAPEKQVSVPVEENSVGDAPGGERSGGVSDGRDADPSFAGVVACGGGSSTGSVSSAGRTLQPPLCRNLGEEASRPPIPSEQPVASFASALLAPATASVTMSDGASSSPAAVAANVTSCETSLERKSTDYGVGTPPRSGRLRPRPGRRGSSGRGRGHAGGAPQSTPVTYLSVRRRKSESGLAATAAAAAAAGRFGEGAKSGPGPPPRGRLTTLRPKRAVSAASAGNVAIGVDSRMPPPAWTWRAYGASGGEGSGNGRGGGGGGSLAWSRGRSDSEVGAVASDGKAPPEENQPAPVVAAAAVAASSAASLAIEKWNGANPGGSGGGSGGGRGGSYSVEVRRSRSTQFPWRHGRFGGQQGDALIYRSRGGSWDSDPRDGRTGARSAPRRGAKRRVFADGAKSVSGAAAVRRSSNSVQGEPAAGLSSDGGGSVAGTVDPGDVDEPGDWLRIYPGDDANSDGGDSVGLPKSVGDGGDGSFGSDGGVGGEAGDTGSLNASGSQAGVVGGEAPNGNGFGGRYQDFGGARFHEVVLERSRGSASRGGTRRVPSSGLDVEAACPCSEDDRELPDEGSFRQQAHKGGMGDGHRRDAHTAEVEEDNLLMRDMCLRLEAEVAKLRNLLASAHGTGTGTESQTGTGPSLGSGASAGAGTPIAGCGGFLSGFSGGGGGDGGGGGGHGQGLPRMSHMVIPEHRTAAWEVMSDDGQGLMWQRQAPFALSWTAGGRAGSDGGGGGGYNGFRPTAPVFVPGQFTPRGGTAAGGLILPHAGQQQQQQQQGVPAGRVPLPRTLRNSPSPPLLGGGNSEGAAWSQGVGVTGGAVCGEPGPGSGGGGGAIPWDDDYRALRARLEVPSLGFGSLRTPGRGACFRKGRGGNGGAPHGGDSLRSRLCEDLSRFLHIVTERERRTFDAKWVAYQRCRAVVRGLWPRAQVKPYGSFVTGLSLPWSDLDLVICLPKVRRDAPADTPGALEGRNAIKETWQQELARSLGGERWVDNNSLKIISHTPVPVIKVTTVGYPPSCAPSTAFAAATAVAAASASGTATASAASAATAIGVGGGIGRTRSPCSPPVGWRGETSVEPGSAASSLPGGPQPTQPPAALEPPPIRAPGDRESAAATAAVAAAVAGVGMGVEDGSGRKGGEGAAPAMAPTANSGSTAVVETPSRDEGGSTTAAAAEAAAATDRDERDRGGVSEKEKRSVSSRPERPVTVKAYSSPLPGPPGESTGGGNERVAQGTKKKAPAKKSPATSSGGAAGGQDHNHHQDHSHDRAHRHDRGVDRASSAGAWAVASGGGGGVGVGVGAGGGGAGGVDPVGLPRVLVDVSFEGQGHNGQAANQLVKDLVDGFPALRPLALLLKQFMMEKGLCVGYTGGLSSYALTLMVARYLQEQTSQMDSGSLLLGFLDFYGNHFDPRRTGISVRRSRYFSRSAPLPPPPPGPPPVPTRVFYGQRGRPPPFQGGLGGTAPPGAPPVGGIPAWGDMMRMPYRFDPLFIEDPMNLSNNVGRNCFRVNQIQRAWSDAHASLTRALDDESQLRSSPSPYRLLRCIISDPEPAPYT